MHHYVVEDVGCLRICASFSAVSARGTAMYLRAIGLVGLVALHLDAHPQELPKSLALAEKDKNSDLVNAFGRCAAVWEMSAATLQGTGQAAAAQQAHQLANGARSSAMYLLGTERAAEGKDPQPYAQYAPYVDGIIEAETARLRALVEAKEPSPLYESQQTCRKLTDLQIEIVQLIRKQLPVH